MLPNKRTIRSQRGFSSLVSSSSSALNVAADDGQALTVDSVSDEFVAFLQSRGADSTITAAPIKKRGRRLDPSSSSPTTECDSNGAVLACFSPLLHIGAESFSCSYCQAAKKPCAFFTFIDQNDANGRDKILLNHLETTHRDKLMAAKHSRTLSGGDSNNTKRRSSRMGSTTSAVHATCSSLRSLVDDDDHLSSTTVTDTLPSLQTQRLVQSGAQRTADALLGCDIDALADVVAMSDLFFRYSVLYPASSAAWLKPSIRNIDVTHSPQMN